MLVSKESVINRHATSTISSNFVGIQEEEESAYHDAERSQENAKEEKDKPKMKNHSAQKVTESDHRPKNNFRFESRGSKQSPNNDDLGRGTHSKWK